MPSSLRFSLAFLWSFPLDFGCSNVFTPKFGTRPIRLMPSVRLVSLNSLTGGASCSRSGNGHTGLTGRPDWWTPSPSRIEESLRISSCKRIPCGARPPHLINIKGRGRLRTDHPIGQTFIYFLSWNPTFPTPLVSSSSLRLFRAL
jgi:hypothetical protein